MMKLLNKYKLDLQLIFLMLITLTSWYFQTDDFKYGFLVFCLIFLYLAFKQKPISHFIVVTLFSVMSLQYNGIFKIEFVLTLMIFFYVVGKNIKNRSIVIGNLFIPLVLFLVYNVISILWTPDKSDGIQGIIDMIEGYMIYFIIINSGIKIVKKHLFDLSKVATYLMLTLSFEIFYNYYLHGFEKVIHSKNLVHLGWDYSNFIAVIFVLLIPIALYKYLDHEKYHIAYFLIDLLNLLGLLLTLSRGAILGVFVSLFIFIILFVRKRFLFRYGSIVGIIAFIIYKHEKFGYYFSLIKDKYLNREFLDDHGRFPLYKLAFERFKENILFGDGIKSSRYMITHFLERSSVHYHNFILQIVATLGIIGLILFLFIVLKWVKVLYKPFDSYVLCSALAIIAGLTHQFVDVSFDLFYFGFIFYGIIAVVEVYRHHIDDDQIKLKIIQKD